jgi:DNA-binding PadR family transcriptional regulator
MAYQLTALGVPVLSLLRARSMHGYEMFQTLVGLHADRIVKIRPGSLYHVVDRLTEEKLIRRAATTRDGKRPERAVYEITDAGVEALQQRVAELIATPVHEFPQCTVALAEIATLNDVVAADAVDNRIGSLESRAAEIMALRDAAVTRAGYLVAFDYVLAMIDAERTWLDSFAGTMRSSRSGAQQMDEVEQ